MNIVLTYPTFERDLKKFKKKHQQLNAVLHINEARKTPLCGVRYTDIPNCYKLAFGRRPAFRLIYFYYTKSEVLSNPSEFPELTKEDIKNPDFEGVVVFTRLISRQDADKMYNQLKASLSPYAKKIVPVLEEEE